jgi:Pyruvate/2-oxoacid:ferredoxin oxidoreductase gamma subunit
MNDIVIRDYAEADRAAVNAVALAAFARMADLPPIRGVSYARYVLKMA